MLTQNLAQANTLLAELHKNIDETEILLDNLIQEIIELRKEARKDKALKRSFVLPHKAACTSRLASAAF